MSLFGSLSMAQWAAGGVLARQKFPIHLLQLVNSWAQRHLEDLHAVPFGKWGLGEGGVLASCLPWTPSPFHLSSIFPPSDLKAQT